MSLFQKALNLYERWSLLRSSARLEPLPLVVPEPIVETVGETVGEAGDQRAALDEVPAALPSEARTAAAAEAAASSEVGATRIEGAQALAAARTREQSADSGATSSASASSGSRSTADPRDTNSPSASDWGSTSTCGSSSAPSNDAHSNTAPIEVPDTLDELEGGGLDMGFDDFLADLGAEAPADAEESALAMKDATIAELKSRLADLSSLGEELAATERARLAAEARIEQLEAAREANAESEDEEGTAERIAELEGKVERLRERLRDREAISRRHFQRIEKMRAKFEERDKVAADRWRELKRLRKRNRRLETELEELQGLLDEVTRSDRATDGDADGASSPPDERAA